MKTHHLMPRILLIIFLGALMLYGTTIRVQATIDVSLQMQLGNPSGATADPTNHTHYLIQRTVEAIDYNADLDEPNWASWDLTASDIGSSGRSPDFFTDTNLPAGFYEVAPGDYGGAGFDRGHMCPSDDRTDNTNDNNMVFFMSNIIPQAPDNNEGVWVNFEDYCRTQAQSGNELLIICGPGGFDGSRIQPSLVAAIPEFTWKIAVVVPPGAGTALSRITAATRVIALKIPNTNGVSTVWQNFVTSAAQIEVDTGFTFFTALPPDVASNLLNKVDGRTASPPVITDFSPTNGVVNDSVVITGSNFTSASEVTFNGVSAGFSVNSDTQITATVPTNSTTGPISVTVPGGTTVSSNIFTVTGSTADLVISKSHVGDFTQGDGSDTYVIQVSNVGNLASTGAVSVTDALPAGLAATAISGFGWNVDLPSLTCTRSDALFPGASYPPLTVTVAVAANALNSVTNAATVTGGGDANPSNNTASDPTTILVSESGGPTITLLGWDVRGLPGGTNNFGTSPFPPTTNAANLTTGGFIRGSGVGTTGIGAGRAWGGNAFTGASATAAIMAHQFFTFTAAAGPGYTVSYSAISKFDYRHSATGPAVGLLQYEVGSGPFVDITALAYPSNTSAGGSLSPINLSGISDLQNVGPGTNVTFRIVNYSGGPSGTWYIFDVAGSSAPDFVVQGSIAPALNLTPIETWRLQWFGTTNNSGTAADTAIVTSDGMPNLLKYALNLDPLVPAANPVVGDISTGFLRLTLPKNPNATDITFLVETTDDLSATWTTNGITVDQDTPSLLQAHDNAPVTSTASGFMRLRVTRP